jgi:hypothetical protein
MNHLVFLNAQAGELEKILSGVKTMIMKASDPAQPSVRLGDGLYFLRDNGECAVRVTATVTRVLFLNNNADEGLSHTLKELQPRLQLTEDQYNDWSARKHVLLVEFESAQKIGAIHVAPDKITDRSDWITIETFDLIT